MKGIFLYAHSAFMRQSAPYQRHYNTLQRWHIRQALLAHDIANTSAERRMVEALLAHALGVRHL